MKNLKNKKYNSGRKHSVTLVTMIVVFLLGLGFVFSSIAGSAPPKYYGDVDGSGKVEAADARLILRASVNLEKLTGDYAKAADMDKNNKIEAADARLALRTAVNLEKPVLFKTGEVETTQKQEPTTKPGSDEKYPGLNKPDNEKGEGDYISYTRHGETYYFELHEDEYGEFYYYNQDGLMCVWMPKREPDPNSSGSKEVGDICPKCGVVIGGHAGECRDFNIDINCPVCGQFCQAFTCHHCPFDDPNAKN